MLFDRHAALAALLALSLPAAAVAAPDCAGGSVVKLHVAQHRVAFQATVTRAGATCSFTTDPPAQSGAATAAAGSESASKIGRAHV